MADVGGPTESGEPAKWRARARHAVARCARTLVTPAVRGREGSLAACIRWDVRQRFASGDRLPGYGRASRLGVHLNLGVWYAHLVAEISAIAGPLG
jgi:hypothetical protein